MKGIFYGVGVGPGDPELITLKAVKILKKVPWLAVPDAGKDNLALSIAAPYIKGKPLIYCPAPMTRDCGALQKAREESARLIAEKLKQGEDVAFITIGDPSIYSTYSYLHRLLTKQGYQARMIPGVPSFCAAAASFSIPLCEGGEPLHILPASYKGTEELLSLEGNKVLMKSGESLEKVKKALQKLGVKGQAALGSRCSTEKERLYLGLDEIPDESDYFSILIVK